MSQDNLEIVRRSFETFNARDVEGLVSLCAEECEFLPLRAQLEGIVYRGHQGVRQFVRDMDEDWEAFRIDPLEFHERWERVAVIGQIGALGQSGVEIDSTAGFVFELSQGRIRRITSHSDPEAALEAVGPADTGQG
jgi:ketosteroid isomerase-like protein